MSERVINGKPFEGFLRGVCSTCQQSGIELIYEDEHTVLQEHEAFGRHCAGRYDFPETTYREEVKA